ncbi:MAG: PhzF family phenazine biosynthesis protein [SAR202 cluster bacterium]|jgi:PhzF family phenazine biosynthesis protein|nr:oxidoreductase [Chloroflexota bacterium]MDP6422573.1 PhzF family phenazine biosynthesis protein [SAR202 cluster bacterium]MDP6662890.1 PhzF family phenazine biosynthesis protein [SAR202 cluster bacterium]MQG57321.1 PhzF family phenazine biosynthesis protein [SAR202 cluster bacterium]MQG70110.1 PhzF family phenazine biosynthesis protein [SAR202 cluster bacterium]|tara:strand:- start:1830 stop:2618 length:789 start_codon:yes stop_codon:yes gene_type:complete
MTIPIYTVDAFTAGPFKGNPAGVCLLDAPAEVEWMQAVAREMNLSETAFLLRRDDGIDLRWFTPAVEVDLCGHATLASSHILWETGVLATRQQARFHTRSGLLTASRNNELIEMDFPADPTRPSEAPAELLDALGAPPTSVHQSRHHYLFDMGSEEAVRSLQPDFAALARNADFGVIVTCASESAEYDFVSRFFAPAVGIDEDPVTGAAHCCLSPFWSERLGSDSLVGYQASARGGVVRVKSAGDHVLLGGEAVTVMKGELG